MLTVDQKQSAYERRLRSLSPLCYGSSLVYCVFSTDLAYNAHSRGALLALTPLMQSVLRRNVRRVWLIWHTELNSAFFSALIENTLLVSITLESLLCVGDQVVQGCSILSSAPLSINLPCLSYHFDQGGVLFLQPGLKFFSNFKGLKTSHFGFPPPSLITAVFLQLPLFRN